MKILNVRGSKILIGTLLCSALSIAAFSQSRTCKTTRVEGSDATYDGMCETNWDVSYDFTVCYSYNGADGHLESYFAFDNGTATDLETGETYLIKVHSGANWNPGPGSVRRDGGTFHWAGVVAGKIVVQLVTHVNYDGNGVMHETRKVHIKCL